VADNSHQISGVAERYASSLYELAADAKSVDAVAKDLDRFQAMIDSNSDLQRLVSSPVFSAEDQSRSIVALTEKAKISGLVGNFLKVVARNRRVETVARRVTAEVKMRVGGKEKELGSGAGKTVTLNVDRCIAAGRPDVKLAAPG
jgi:F-type H+-transporting ATPase subunit delta